MPAITFCPHQTLDELHLVSILLNQIRFRCLDLNGANDTLSKDLDLCSDEHMVHVRGIESPFRGFLQRLEGLVNSVVGSIGK